MFNIYNYLLSKHSSAELGTTEKMRHLIISDVLDKINPPADCCTIN